MVWCYSASMKVGHPTITSMLLLIVLTVLLSKEAYTLESPSPEKYLQPRDFNPHPYRAQSLNQFQPSNSNNRNGPVLFPNDTPQNGRTPLVVTVRPLSEQIVRGDQNTVLVTPRPLTNPYNLVQNPHPSLSGNPLINAVNQIADDTHNIHVFDNNYYRDYVDPNANTYLDKFYLRQNASDLTHPYAAVARKSKLFNDNISRKGFNAIEEHTIVPPIYNALANYAKQKVLNNKKKQKSSHETNTIESPTGNSDDYDDASANEAKQYAFSYSVKDHDTGDDFSHTQRHLGSATKGEYRVKLPDGRVQIVSYTADNGGYKADVRYEEDKEVSDNLVHENVISTTQRPLSVYQNEKSELGRIVVPSQEEKDYQEVEYYYYDDEAPSSTRSPNYVTNENKELLITSKPGYIYTPTASPLKAFSYPDSKYIVTPTPVPYVTTNRIESSTSSPKKYLHFYDAESVKFVSTTPNYYHVSSSTPVAHFHKYNHLNSLGSRVQPSSPPSTTATAVPPPYRGVSDTKPVTEDLDTVGLGRYYNPRRPTHLIDFRKYFTFNRK